MKGLVIAALAGVLASGVGCGSSGGAADGGGSGSSGGGTSGGAGTGSGGGGSGGGTAGKSGDGGAGTCQSAVLGSKVSWAEDGAPKCAYAVVAQRSTEGTTQLLQLQGATLTGASVALGVFAYGGVLEGSHVCAGVAADGGLIGTPGTFYVTFVHTGTLQTCSITITNGGTPGGATATGTFTATFTGIGGAAITNGVFDTPVQAPPTTKK